MSKFIKFISEQDKKDYYDNIENSIILDEALNRNIIIRSSSFYTEFRGFIEYAEYEWDVDNKTYYLFVNKTSETSYSFKFTNSKLEVHSTKQLNKPATSVFSGAILAIKEFLENHKNVIYFSIDAIKNELNRVSLYKTGSKLLAKETGFEYLGELTDDPNFIKYVFKSKENKNV